MFNRHLLLRKYIVVGVSVLSLLTACNSINSQISGKATAAPTVSISPTATPQPAFPSFSDWRAAYMASNFVVHAVTFNGKIDVSGPSLTQYNATAYPVNDGIAPDGHTFAYSTLGMNILDLRTGVAAFPHDLLYILSNTMFWSYDGQNLAIGDNERFIWIVDLISHTIISLPLQLASDQRIILLGWIDSSHLAVMTGISSPVSTGDYVFESVSIPNGKQHVIATLNPQIWNGNLYYPTISPDGSQILVSNRPFRDYPFTPQVAVIMTKTGQVRNFSAIAQTTGGAFNTITWQPGQSNSVDVSTGFNINGNADSWALNLSADSATHLVKGWYPTAWSPDGKTLILSTESRGEGQTPPFSIEAMTFDSQGHIASQTVLTRAAYGFPFMGFIKTSG